MIHLIKLEVSPVKNVFEVKILSKKPYNWLLEYTTEFKAVRYSGWTDILRITKKSWEL